MRIGALTTLLCLGGSMVLPAAEDTFKVLEGLRFKEDYTQAESLLREALKTASDSDTPDLRNDLADLLREQDRASEARSYFDEASHIREAPWQAHFGAIPSLWQTGLAAIDRQEEAWQESIGKWNEAVGIAKTYGNTLYESFAIRGLGDAWLDSGDLSRAECLLKRSLALVDAGENQPGGSLVAGRRYRKSPPLFPAGDQHYGVLSQLHPGRDAKEIVAEASSLHAK